MKRKWMGAVLAGLCMMLLTACGAGAAKKPPELTVDEVFFAYREVAMQSLGAAASLAVEQNGFRTVPVVDGRGLAAFGMEDGALCCHVEGYLGALVRDLPKTQTPEELAEKLSWQGGSKAEAVQVADAADGTHVAKECVAIELDTDGDATPDAVLEVAVKDGAVSSKSRARLIWSTNAA